MSYLKKMLAFYIASYPDRLRIWTSIITFGYFNCDTVGDKVC